MTNRTGLHTIAASELAGRLGAVLNAVEGGSQYAITRHGKVIAVLEPASTALETPVSVGSSRWAVEEPGALYGTAPSPAMQPDSALSRLFGNATMRAVMALFVREPDAVLYQRQVSRRAGVGLRSAQIALDRLENLGLVASERDGNRRYYRAIRSSRFEDLRRLLSREFGATEVIARYLHPLESSISWAFIFGSAATGEDTLESDIDLLVMGDVSDDDLVSPIAEAQRELGRDIDTVTYRPIEFDRKRAERNHFLHSILTRPRIDVIGGPDDA